METNPDNAAEKSQIDEPFTIDELFFSTTDERGFIQSSNDVFVRVSRYGVEELLGQPHNIIRHPDMPRVVFRILWDHLKAGKGIGAYVVNRAKDGSPYWVYAIARPVEDGYLSVRLKPTTELFGVVTSLYRELLQVEAKIEEGGRHHREAMDASETVLSDRLQQAGFADYSTFMRTASVAEVRARRTAIGLGSRRRASDPVAYRSSDELAQAAFLDGQLDAVESYMSINQGLTERSELLAALATETSLLGFNLKAASARLGSDGGPLTVLAGIMQDTGADLVHRARSLVQVLDSTRAVLQRMGFLVAVAALQDDMAAQLVAESGADGHAADNIALMSRCREQDLAKVFDALSTIERNLAEAGDLANDLERSLRTLGAVISSGRVEASRTMGAHLFIALFERAQELVDAGLEGSRHVAASVRTFSHTSPRDLPRLEVNARS